jgi:type III secretion inner rod protein HrpB2
MDPISPIAAVSSAVSLPNAGGAVQPSELAVKKFEAMMSRTEGMLPTQAVSAAVVPGADAVNPVTRTLSAQEAAFRDIEVRIQEFTAQAPSLGLNEMVSRSIELGHVLAQATTALTATTSIAQGANKGLQSLLKNQ